MAQIMMRTSIEEADMIANGTKDFIFRGKNLVIGHGDILTFTAYKDKKPTRHKIDRMKFTVRYISTEAPIEHGFKVIGFENKM